MQELYVMFFIVITILAMGGLRPNSDLILKERFIIRGHE